MWSERVVCGDVGVGRGVSRRMVLARYVQDRRIVYLTETKFTSGSATLHAE